MAAAEQTVELDSTKEIDLPLPVMPEIDFADAFASLNASLVWDRQTVEAVGTAFLRSQLR